MTEEPPECLNIGPSKEHIDAAYLEQVCEYCPFKDGCRWFQPIQEDVE